MLYLVTGGLGYLGGRLVEHLLQQGHGVRVTTRRPVESCPDWAAGIDVCQVNGYDKYEWNKALEGVNFVFHLAAPDASSATSDPNRALRADGELTWTLLDAVAGAKEQISVIKVSTFHVYGPDAEGLILESTLPKPSHPYAISHLLSEMVTQSFCYLRDIRALNVRLSNVFGRPTAFESAQWSLVFNDLCMQAATSDRLCLKSTGQQKRNFITLEDAVRALLFLADRYDDWPDDHTIHLGSPTHWSIRDVADRIARRSEVFWGKYPEITVPEAGGEPSPKDFIYDVSRLRDAGFVWQNEFDREIDNTLIACKRWRKRV